MNFIFSKVFVNIKTVLQNYYTQCLYWLNFFFGVYKKINSTVKAPNIAHLSLLTSIAYNKKKQI